MQSEVNVKFCDITQIPDAPLFFTILNKDPELKVPKQLYILLKDMSADYPYIVANVHLGRIEETYKNIGEFMAAYEGAILLDIKVETTLAGFLKNISPNVRICWYCNELIINEEPYQDAISSTSSTERFMHQKCANGYANS